VIGVEGEVEGEVAVGLPEGEAVHGVVEKESPASREEPKS